MWTIAPAALAAATSVIASNLPGLPAWLAFVCALGLATLKALKWAFSQPPPRCEHLAQGECDDCWHARQW